MKDILSSKLLINNNNSYTIEFVNFFFFNISKQNRNNKRYKAD